MTTTDATQELARFVVDTTTIPPAARHAGRRTILNTVGLAIGASAHPAVDRVRSTLADLGGPGQAAVLGCDERLPAPWAAMVNGVAAHVEDFDDTHLATMIHPGASVVPAALAAAELVDASESELLDAVCLGVEIALRVGECLGQEHFARGWHPTGSLGPLGAAAAACRLLGADVEVTRQGLGLAGTQAAGFLAALGSMTKALHPGRAAANGLESALLVRRGFTAPTRIIEGRRGLGELVSTNADYERLLHGLDTSWAIEANAFKPYACGIVSHPVLDAARELASHVGADAGWRSLTVTVDPVVPEVMGVERPQDGLASKFSVYHCVAIGLLGFEGGPGSFTDQMATDPKVDALRSRISVVPDDRVRRDEAWLVGLTEDGERHEVHVQHARGSLAGPMSDTDLAAKVRLVSEGKLGANGVTDLVTRCMRMGDRSAPVADLVALTSPALAFRG